MLVLLSILEGERDCSTHIIILVKHWQFGLLLGSANLMVLLVGLQIEFDVDFDSSSQTTEERRKLLLCRLTITMNLVPI